MKPKRKGENMKNEASMERPGRKGLSKEEIAGSECNEFRLSAGQKEISSLMNLSENYALSGSSYLNPASGSPFNGSLTGYLCLDEQNVCVVLI